MDKTKSETIGLLYEISNDIFTISENIRSLHTNKLLTKQKLCHAYLVMRKINSFLECAQETIDMAKQAAKTEIWNELYQPD